MATTNTVTGSLRIDAEGKVTFSGDNTGTRNAKHSVDITFASAGGTAPTISGYFKGTLTAAAGTILLAHASDPLQGMGDASYSDGFTVASSKLKLLMVENLDSTNSITITSTAAVGLPIFAALGDGLTLAPGDVFLLYKKAGTAALTTGSNDSVTIAPSAGSPTATVTAFYGP